MDILITEVNDSGGCFRCESTEGIKIGSKYEINNNDPGTNPQNNAFHALVWEFWKWMFRNNTFIFEDNGVIYDLSTPDPGSLKDFLKYRYGQGDDWVKYVGNEYSIVKVGSISEVPLDVLKDFNSGNSGRIERHLKSWSDYKKPERMELISILLAIIHLSGCNSPKIEEIISGMEMK